MDQKAFRHLVNNNPEFRQWLKDNEAWVKANRGTVKEMMRQMEAKASQTVPKKRAAGNKKIKLPKFNLSTITNATQQLTRTFDMIDNVQTIISIMRTMR